MTPDQIAANVLDRHPHLTDSWALERAPKHPKKLATVDPLARGANRDREIARLRALGVSRGEIAARAGITPKSVSEALRRRRAVTGDTSNPHCGVTPGHDTEIAQLREEGKTLKEIAAELRMSLGGVWQATQRIKRLAA